jgi:exopolyphosphatase / guanosine-5'-triphosphate,3'-diphosphate pyrophosphatase
VRISAGMGEDGALRPEAVERALDVVEVFAHFCRASRMDDVRTVATSAIRDAANREAFLARAREVSRLEIEVLSRQTEAFYGYVAAVNSTTLSDGLVLDLGGGSLQLVRVGARRLREAGSWPLGSVRTTERFLPDEKASKKQMRALREHARERLAGGGWAGEHVVGIGGTVRNLAVAAQKAAELPEFGVQGYRLTAEALADLVERLAALPASQRGAVPGVKPERGDLILAGAIVVQAALESAGAAALEVTEAGLREGIFLTTLLDGDPPLIPDVRGASVRNLAREYGHDDAHARHVAALSLSLFDQLAAAGLHPGDDEERELLWAAALLHDIGDTVDYDDHHKHSRYLILNAGLPGFSPREVALIALMARYHRKGSPSGGFLRPWLRRGDEALVTRCAALLRVAEQLERSRDQVVREVRAAADDEAVTLTLMADEDVAAPRWGALRQRDVFARAFARQLEVA